MQLTVISLMVLIEQGKTVELSYHPPKPNQPQKWVCFKDFYGYHFDLNGIEMEPLTFEDFRTLWNIMQQRGRFEIV